MSCGGGAIAAARAASSASRFALAAALAAANLAAATAAFAALVEAARCCLVDAGAALASPGPPPMRCQEGKYGVPKPKSGTEVLLAGAIAVAVVSSSERRKAPGEGLAKDEPREESVVFFIAKSWISKKRVLVAKAMDSSWATWSAAKTRGRGA